MRMLPRGYRVESEWTNDQQPACCAHVTEPGWLSILPPLVLPILTMILAMPVGLYVARDGNLIEGSGSTVVLWSVCAAILTA